MAGNTSTQVLPTDENTVFFATLTGILPLLYFCSL